MSRTNETRYIEWHETCKCKCRLDANVYNNKKRCNNNKCRCESKELIYKGLYDKGSVWNSSNCECECDKLCDVGEYLNYENFKCRKKLVDKSVEECTENIDEVKIAEFYLSMEISVYVLTQFVIVLTISIGVHAYFAYK